MNPIQARIVTISGVAALLGLLTAVPAAAAPVFFEVGGDATTASILPTVNNFRTQLGDNNGNGPGTTGGRREINWDGRGGVSTNSPGGTPFDVFLNKSRRAVHYPWNRLRAGHTSGLGGYGSGWL